MLLMPQQLRCMKLIKNNMLKQNSTIGIFGGGQLGRMTANAAHELGFKTVIFSDVANSPASFVSNQTIIADYLDENALNKFAQMIDIATFEFENIPVAAVDFVAKLKPVYPSSKVLNITQNRLNEKNFVNSIGIKTADFLEINSGQDLKSGFEKFGPSVLKTATMGYDGKGQKVLKQGDDLEKIWHEFSKHKLILEKFVDFECEASIIVARSVSGEISCYEPLRNVHKDGILRQSFYPSQLTKQTVDNAVTIATSIVDKLDLIGLLAIEFFVLKNGELLVNELAPRPHNSGHFSMNASCTSQFEQLIRAIADMNLGNPEFHSSGHMDNLIGDEVFEIEKFLKNKNAKIHLYGKDKVAVGRKMGHVNLIDQNRKQS